MASERALLLAWRALLDAGVRLPDGWHDERATSVWLAVLVDVDDEDLMQATYAYLRQPRAFWPLPGDLIAMVRPAATRDDVATTAESDLAYLRMAYRMLAGETDDDKLLGAMLPLEGQAVRTAPIIREVEVPNRHIPGRTMTTTHRSYPPCSAADAERNERIRRTLLILGGVPMLRQSGREADGDAAASSLGFRWRAAYQSAAAGAQRPGPLRLLDGGRADDAAVKRADVRDMAHVGAVIDGLRRP